MSWEISQLEEKKLFGSLVVQQRILLYLLSDGRRADRLWTGCVVSFIS